MEQAREQKRKRQIAVLNAKLKSSTLASDASSSASLSPNSTQLKNQVGVVISTNNNNNNHCDKASVSASPSRQSFDDQAAQPVRSQSMEPVVLSVTTV